MRPLDSPCFGGQNQGEFGESNTPNAAVFGAGDRRNSPDRLVTQTFLEDTF